MKSYTPIIVAVALVLAGLAVSFVTARQMLPAQSRLNADIDAKVQKAASMLAAYDPLDAALARAIETPGTQPADGVAEDSELKARAALISQALEVAREAVSARAEGDDTLSGETNAAATRLEAILYIAQADVLRREAAAHRARADVARQQLTDLTSHWREVHTVLQSLARDVGGAAPSATEFTAEAPASAPAARTDTASPNAAAPPAPRTRASGRGAISGLFRKFAGGAAPQPAPPSAQPQPQPGPAPQAPVAEAAPQPTELAPIIFEKLPTVAERIAELKKQRETIAAQITDAQPEIQRLTAETKELETRVAAARAKADEARKRMLQLEQAGIDASDPQSLARFTKAYEEASRIFRESDREATILQYGSVVNARPATDDEDEVLRAPLAPVSPDAKMESQRGLESLRTDLAAATGLVETRTAVLAQLDEQIARLDKQQADVTARLTKLKGSLDDVVNRVAQTARIAIAESMEAAKIETEALDLLNGPAQQSVRRAVSAAGQAVNDVRTFYSTNAPTATTPQLGFITGHAKTLEGDLQYELSLLQAQRAADIERHQRALQQIARMGVSAESLLPKDVAAADAPPWAIRVEAAGADAKQAREEARKTAQAALDIYLGADNDLKQAWVLHTNIAAVHHFLAGLSTEPAEARKHLQEARRQYEISIRDRRDRPEAQPYKRIIDTLSQSLAR